MSANHYDAYGRRYNSTTLRARTLPPGKRIYSAAGVSESKERLLKFARRSPHCPVDIEAVTAESVGLDWVKENGEVLDVSEKWRKDYWVIIEPIPAE
jgi:hypothetical protein